MRSSQSFKSFSSSDGRGIENLLRYVVPLHSKSFPDTGLPKLPCSGRINIRELDPTRPLWDFQWYQLASLNALSTSDYGILFPAPTLRVSALQTSSLKAIALAFPGDYEPVIFMVFHQAGRDMEP